MKYEYKTVEQHNKIATTTLNDLGAEGWQLIGITMSEGHTTSLTSI